MALPVKQFAEERLDQLARKLTNTAIRTIEEIMVEGEKDSDRLAAAREVLSRGYGTPISATIAIPANKKNVAMLMGLSDEELERRALADEPERIVHEQTLSQATLEAFASVPDMPDAEQRACDTALVVGSEFDGAPDTPAATLDDFDPDRYLDDIKPPNRFLHDPLLG